MRKYEVGFILKPISSDEEIQNTISKLKEIYTKGNSKIIDEFDMGMRNLAYNIEKFNSGYYYFLNVESDGETNKEFERICRIDENVIRFMVINIEHVEGSTLDMLRQSNSQE